MLSIQYPSSIYGIMKNIIAASILIIYLSPSVNAQYQPSSCFATHQIVLFGGTSATTSTFPNVGGYPFNLTWWDTYPNLTASSYAISGLKMGVPNMPLSYTATLTANPTNGVFTFILDSHSSIVYAAFSIVLLSSCNSGIIYLQRFSHTTTVINSPSRTFATNFETLSIVIPFTFSNFTGFTIRSFISSFRCTSFGPNLNQTIQLSSNGWPTQPNNITFLVFSWYTQQNVVTEVTVTHIIANISSFNKKLMFYGFGFWHDDVGTNFNIPAIYNQNFTKKCFIGLIQIGLGPGTVRPSQMFYVDSGTLATSNISNLINVNTMFFGYVQLAIMECDIHGLVDSYAWPTECKPCSDTIPNCLSCTSPIQCIDCVVGVPVTGGCTEVTRCISVIWNSTIGASPCTACKPGFILVSNRCSCPPGNWFVAGGCTNVSMCVTAMLNSSNNISTCTACSPGSFFNNSACYCQLGYWMITQYCTNIIGCITTKLINNQVVCAFCNVIDRYQLNGTGCSCVLGFYMDSASRCLEICGDGRIFIDQCDDGNLEDGDGCSSNCKNESTFICVNGSQTHKSDCVYSSHDFRLTLKWIDKNHMKNQGIFAFEVHPSFSSLKRLNLTANLKFNCEGRGQFVSWKYNAGVLLLNVDYHQNLQGYPANITLIFDPTFIIQKTFQIPFDMVSHGDKLIIVNNYGKCAILINVMIVLSFVVLFLFVVGSLSHKMIGIEILHAFQAIFLFQALGNNFTPIFGLLRYFSLVAGNFLFLSNAQTNIYTSKSDIHYNPTNQELSEAIIVGVSIFLSLCILPFLCAWAQSVDDPQSNRNKFSTKVLNIIYGCLLFPFIVGFLIINLLNIVIDSQSGLMFPDLPFSLSGTLSLILILISSFIFSFEGKLLMVKKSCWTSLQGLLECDSWYISIYQIYILFLTIIMAISYHQNFDYSIEILATIVFTFFIYFAINRPYQSCLHNAGQIMNLLMVIYFMGWMIARKYFEQITTEENQFFCMFLLCGLMAACLIISSIRTIDELRQKCKTEDNNPNQKIEKKDTLKDQLSEWDKQKQHLQKVLHNFNSFYGKVQKADERLEQISKINKQRLIQGSNCLYSKNDIEDNLLKMPKLYNRRNDRRIIDLSGK